MANKRERMPRPVAVNELLSAVFRGTPTEKRLKEGCIWQVWDSAVGKQIASRARPVSFRAGTLTVAVTSAPWMQQLSFLKKGIMEKLNAYLGEEIVRDLYLKAGVPSRPAPSPSPPKTYRALTSKEELRVAEVADIVTDPELRGSLARLYARYLSLK
jgi:hypothetical protein